MKHETAARIGKAAAALLGLAAAFCAVVFLWQPPCLILKFTGFACAGCGGQRMLHALLRGDIAGAFFHNPFLFCFLPVLAGYILWEALRYIKGRRPLYQSRPFLYALCAVLLIALIFTVLRNLPGFSFLGP